MSDWTRVTLGEVCAKPQYGAIASASDQPGGPRFVRQTDIRDGRIDWSTVPYCNLTSSDQDKYALAPDDLLIARLGSVGRAARVRDPRGAVFAGYLVRFRANPARALPAYLGYQLQSREWLEYVEAVRSGAVQPTLNAQQMAAYSFASPPIATQRAIAEVLGALDDKIEANRRTQSGAEDLARAELARAQQEDVETMVSIGTLVERVANVLQPTQLAEDDVYIGLEHMPRGSLLLKEHGTAQGLISSKAAFKSKDVLFGRLRPYFKKVVVAPTAGVCSTDILVLRPKADKWAVAAAVCASDDVIDYASGGSEGTRMPRVSWEYLARYEVPLPGPDAGKRLEARMAPLLQFGMGLTVESVALASLRDALLPKLLSGELRVRDAEHLVEEAV